MYMMVGRITRRCAVVARRISRKRRNHVGQQFCGATVAIHAVGAEGEPVLVSKWPRNKCRRA